MHFEAELRRPQRELLVNAAPKVGDAGLRDGRSPSIAKVRQSLLSSSGGSSRVEIARYLIKEQRLARCIPAGTPNGDRQTGLFVFSGPD